MAGDAPGAQASHNKPLMYYEPVAYKDPADRNAYARAWYAANAEKHKALVAKRDARYTAEIKEFLDEVKDVPCMDCGGSFPTVCMDFDHREGTTKLFSIGEFRRLKVSRAKLLAEMDKCDIVCANCHRIRTATRRGVLVTVTGRPHKPID